MLLTDDRHRGNTQLALLQRLSWSEGLYLAWITALTIGYGDLTPKTGAARLRCIAIALVGLVFSALFTGIALDACGLTIERYPGILG
ncbi:MAG: two pore domain potassium channel family protein [Gammaproteobacteria bacterium]|nr:two pore domain potassium channel family protein [Gammaproteobacteria bacterium]